MTLRSRGVKTPSSKDRQKGLPARKIGDLVKIQVSRSDRCVFRRSSRASSVEDDGDLQEVYETERQLLYVACTRARDSLCITSVEAASEFLDDLRQK